MKTIVKFVEFAYSPTLIASNQEHLYIVSTCYVFRFEKRKKTAVFMFSHNHFNTCHNIASLRVSIEKLS